jgi:hypothetical protein
MSIILKRNDDTSICCPNLRARKSSESAMKRVELLIAIGLLILGVWIILALP